MKKGSQVISSLLTHLGFPDEHNGRVSPPRAEVPSKALGARRRVRRGAALCSSLPRFGAWGSAGSFDTPEKGFGDPPPQGFSLASNHEARAGVLVCPVNKPMLRVF